MAEKIIVTNEQDYQHIHAELNARKKPSKTLKFMMQALENYRQSKKMGWSRGWNKYGVVNFQSFKLKVTDMELRQQAWDVLLGEAVGMPETAQLFVASLLQDHQAPMGFLFFQEFTDQGRQYEGAVVSYGRINTDNKRFRDRLDIIFESEIVDGVSQGLSRIRIYVDPYIAGIKEPLWQMTLNGPFQADTVAFFEHLAGLSWAWANDRNRLWQHWVIDYIDYFGPRQWCLQKSYFYMSNLGDHTGQHKAA